jgi:hypothetical protein
VVNYFAPRGVRVPAGQLAPSPAGVPGDCLLAAAHACGWSARTQIAFKMWLFPG